LRKFSPSPSTFYNSASLGSGDYADVQQFIVLKRITLTLQRMLERGLAEALGRDVPVVLRHDSALQETLEEQVGLLHVGVQRRGEVLDREFEVEDGVERFRNPPIGLRAQYLVSAWATPPEDQLLLGA
jgi:hypothetical protein